MEILHWEQLTSKNKKTLSGTRPILILGPRDISQARIQQLQKKISARRTTTNKLTVVWGCLTDKFIPGLKGSPQFSSLSLKKLTKALNQLSPEQQPSAILVYPQRYINYIIKEIQWSAIIGVNGSWHHAFHYRPEYCEISKKKLTYKLVSSFVNEVEAKKYEAEIKKKIKLEEFIAQIGQKFSDQELMKLAERAAQHSFDWTFQTGAVLARDRVLLAVAHNRVVPYETFSFHHGASKEKQLAPPQDLNYFDTNHAEVELILQALEKKIDLAETSLYINLLPCPICARMLARSPIGTIVYQHDHSQGYGFKLLKQAGKKVKRF